MSRALEGGAYGETALVWAAEENHAEAADILIEHGADVNARTNPLERAKDRFGLEGVLTILPHGSWTPLMYAARQGSLETARTTFIHRGIVVRVALNRRAIERMENECRVRSIT